MLLGLKLFPFPALGASSLQFFIWLDGDSSGSALQLAGRAVLCDCLGFSPGIRYVWRDFILFPPLRCLSDV